MEFHEPGPACASHSVSACNSADGRELSVYQLGIMNDHFMEPGAVGTSRQGPYEDCGITKTHNEFLSGTFMSWAHSSTFISLLSSM